MEDPDVAVEELEVREFQGSPEDWDAFMATVPESTACHLAGWDRALSDVLGNEVVRLVAVDGDGRTAAALPLARVRSRIFGDYLVSMPFLNDGGPVGDPAGRRRLAEAARERARTAGVDLLEIRSRQPVSGEGLVRTDRKITVMLDLPAEAARLWEDGFRSKLRSQIRRPMKEGMETRFGADQVDAFYDILARNMRDLGTPVLPRAFFHAVVAEMPDTTWVGVVYHAGQPVAGGFGLVWNGEVEMTWASSVREFDTLAPNMLLYWSFMERAIEKGLGRFNFGRCTRGSGTHRFKRQWGGEDVDLPWAQWSKTGITSTPTPDGGAMSIAVNVWRRLPLGVTNRVGPLLARRIP
jgi:FemAB-related protein (PEP-CTERM system-associated)